MRKIVLFIPMAALPLLPPAASAQDEWDRAEAAIVRLEAADFPDLPAPVAAAIEVHGCTIPQTAEEPEPHNVVSGRFAQEDQVDWAFLCSRGGTSEIHVVWGGPVRCPSPLAPVEDRAFLQGIGGGRIGYSRRIGAVSRSTMERLQQAFRGPPVPPVRHEGLSDAFVGKASSIVLCVDGRWLALQGMDE